MIYCYNCLHGSWDFGSKNMTCSLTSKKHSFDCTCVKSKFSSNRIGDPKHANLRVSDEIKHNCKNCFYCFIECELFRFSIDKTAKVNPDIVPQNAPWVMLF